MTLVLFQLLNGFVWGWVVALMALGLSLIYGVLRIINVAHGVFYMLGAVAGYALLGPLQDLGVDGAMGFVLALMIAPLLVGLFGALVEALVLQPIVDKPIITIIATFALLLIFQQSVQLLLPGVHSVPTPLRGGIALFGLRYPVYRLALAGIALLIIVALGLFLYRTRFGVWARAVRQDRELALALGIPVPWVYSLTFGLGTALAAAAGVLTAPIVSVEATMGMDVLLETFIVVIVGGLGSLRGAVVAALIFRIAEGLFAAWVEPVTARAFALLLLGSVLLVRPHGLFGREGD